MVFFFFDNVLLFQYYYLSKNAFLFGALQPSRCNLVPIKELPSMALYTSRRRQKIKVKTNNGQLLMSEDHDQN